MKISVASWFDKKALAEAKRIVSISRGEPRGAKFDHKIWEFCPSGQLLGAFKRKEIDEKQYEQIYYSEITDKLHRGIAQLEDGDVLCCWEPAGSFCHRYLLSDLLCINEIEVERK